VRILYRDREAWVDLREEPEGTEAEPWEQEALQAFLDALPNLPKEIEVCEGRAYYWLQQTGFWRYDHKETAHFAEYVMAVPGFKSLLPRMT
jgi:hypothetical protein